MRRLAGEVNIVCPEEAAEQAQAALDRFFAEWCATWTLPAAAADSFWRITNECGGYR